MLQSRRVARHRPSDSLMPWWCIEIDGCFAYYGTYWQDASTAEGLRVGIPGCASKYAWKSATDYLGVRISYTVQGRSFESPLVWVLLAAVLPLPAGCALWSTGGIGPSCTLCGLSVVEPSLGLPWGPSRWARHWGFVHCHRTSARRATNGDNRW